MSTHLPPPDRRTVEPTRDQLAALAHLEADRPVVMLNLVRFREEADYSERPDLAPVSPISGSEAYRRYSTAAQAFLTEVGGELEQFRRCGPTVIGPDGEHWDAMLTVRYPSVAAFRSMTSNPAYLEVAAHRTAALSDSRIVPTLG